MQAAIFLLSHTEDVEHRPSYSLTGRQDAAREALLDTTEELAEELREAGGDLAAHSGITKLKARLASDVRRMYISLLDHSIKGSEYGSALVSFLMVLALRPDNTWESYANYTPKLSVLMAISRLFVVLHAFEEAQTEVQQAVDGGEEKAAAEQRLPSVFERVRDMTRRFMVSGGDGWATTPAQFILRLRNYGMHAQSNDITSGSLTWEGEAATYKGLRVTVSGVQSMLRQALHAASELLYRSLLFVDGEGALPAIPWGTIVDNAADSTIGHSVVSMLLGLEPSSQGWLFRQIWSSAERRRAWSVDTEGARSARAYGGDGEALRARD